MSSKKAMKQAQKQAYAKHRSSITNSRFNIKNKNSSKKIKRKINFLFQIFRFSYIWTLAKYLLHY
jgi:hypothetical protein